MKKIKQIFFIFTLFGIFLCAHSAFAVTPTISVSADSSNSSLVTLSIYGAVNSSAILYYYSSTASGPQAHYIGTTNSSGNLSVSLSLSDYNITQNSAVSVLIGGVQSSSINWPYAPSTTATTTLTFSQSSLALKIGQTSTITTSNTGSYSLYLSSNTNPQVANFSISGNQITATGISSGQTAATFCLITTSGSSNCATMYAVVQTSSSGSLSFSQNDTSIISGQNVSITISGGTGFYQVQNNSNSSAITASLNGPTLTLYANGTTGSTTIAICSTDMSTCGIIKASIGTYTTSGTGLSVSTTYPTISTGQTSTITLSGGYGAYYISSNSNSSVVQTYISGSTLTLYANSVGNSTVTVCAPSGQCGSVYATVVSTSGGALSLSQSSLGVLVGQVLSVTITGGTSPYSIIQSNDGIAQYSLSGSIVSVTGVSAGSSEATICSAGGACVYLNVTVTSSGSTVSGVQPVFSQNNFSINTSQTTAVYMTGNGGYYISYNSNSNVVSASVSGTSLVLYGVAIGSANITVCQTGGQCNTLYVTVSNSTTSTVSSVPISFDKTSVSLSVGGSSNVTVTGGSGVGYYVSYNSNSDVIGVYVNGGLLTITGKAKGSGTISICSSANVCGSIAVTISGSTSSSDTTTTVSSTQYKFTKYLTVGSSGTEVTELQKKLKEEGLFTGSATGYFGSITKAAVKKYQKLKGIDQLGVVGPATRTALNK